MHRWFFANEREECDLKPQTLQETSLSVADESFESAHIVYTDWPFCVRVKEKLQGNEFVAITGNCQELGNWDPKQVKLMKRSACDTQDDCECGEFELTISIPRNIDIEYRYCIVGYELGMEASIIRFWEVALKPRVIRTCHNLLKNCDIFGYTSNNESDAYRVDRGWATIESYIHFKVFNAPFVWLKQSPRLLYVHVQPMYVTEPNCQRVSKTSVNLSIADGLLNRLTLDIEGTNHLAFTEVGNLRFSNPLRYQAPHGARCGTEDLQLFHCSVANPTDTIYRLDLYTFARKAAPDEPAYHYGYGFILPEQLVESEGEVCVLITCASTQRPLIEMNVKYLIVRPVPDVSCDLSLSYTRYWRAGHMTMDMGHRGSGKTYRVKNDVYRENTLFGFRQAKDSNADMVEFDVMLTKDAQVVVHHDSVLKFTLNCAAGLQKLEENFDLLVFPFEHLSRLKLLAMGGEKRGEYIFVPLEAFTYEELRMARAVQFTGSTGCDLNCDYLLQEQQPFPLLSDLFDEQISKLPQSLGFNIELKWPQKDMDRHWQDNGFRPGFDRNLFVDTILQIVFKYGERRRIIFTSFDADICIMLRFKQNYYPVMQLLADPTLPVPFLDERVNNVDNAIHMAYVLEFFGLNLHTKIVTKNPLTLSTIRDYKLHAITFGPCNNQRHNREKFKRYGAIGVTFDRINQPNQIGEELEDTLCCFDSLASRIIVQQLEETERMTKCNKP